jgi:hypothetical protein
VTAPVIRSSAWFCVANYAGSSLVEWSGGPVRSRRKHG